MVTRRNLLSAAGAAGTLAVAGRAGCAPLIAMENIPGLSVSSYSGVSAEFIERRKKALEKDQKLYVGYPSNRNMLPEGYYKWRDTLFELEFGKRTSNSVGDPYELRNPGVRSHYLECDIIDRFGARFGFDLNDIWGFISHSGTDSNMHGAYIGRTLLNQKTGIDPKIYYTKETHYSIQIIKDLMRLEEILVDTNAEGGMDSEDLKVKLKANNDAPALVIATIGTTFIGAMDNMDDIQAALKDYDSYVHLDAALFGGYLHASKFKSDLYHTGPNGKRYNSIAVSCHKFFGFPNVAGIFITNKTTFETYRDYFSQVHDPAYISHVPGTITTSRDSMDAVLFHYFCTDEAFAQQEADAASCLTNAEYFYKELVNHFSDIRPKWENNRSNIVHFKRVDERVKKKWGLATIGQEGSESSFTHVIMMPHVTRPYVDQFLSDLEKYKT